MSEAQLRAVLGEIEARAISSKRELNVVNQQVAQKQRSVRLLDLTIAELTALPKDTPLFEGVGKMFMQTSQSTVTDRMTEERTGTQGDLAALQKKHDYLQTTFDNANMHIKAAMGQ